MMGYLWYDALLELFNGDAKLDTLGHHVLGICSHLSSRLSDNHAAGYYSMLVYLAEISTPFLHSTWLMHQLKFTDSSIFKVFVVLLLGTFVCRCCVGPYMVMHMISFQPEWARGENKPDPQEFDYLFWGNVVVVSLFAFLNFSWFYILIKIALKKPRKESTDKKKNA